MPPATDPSPIETISSLAIEISKIRKQQRVTNPQYEGAIEEISKA
jgi:hypothetical protein